ncbi:MAG: EAL domain-containing protein [Pseudomonadota bacterium]
MSFNWRSVTFHGSFMLLYAGAVVLANLLIDENGSSITPIWPPAGVGMACLLLGGIRAWPTVALGIVIGQAFSVPLDPIFYVYAMVANVVSVVAAVTVLRHFYPQNLVMIRLKSGLILFSGGIIVAVIAATIGVLGLAHAGLLVEGAGATTWAQWALGDIFGVVICAPALLSIGRVLQNPGLLAEDEAYHRLGEKLAWLGGVLASAFLWVWLSEQSPAYALAVTFLPLTFLGWSALRFDHLFTTLAVMIITLTIVTFIGQGYAGFAVPETALESVILLLFFSIMGILPLMVSAAAHQSRYYADQLSYRANHDNLTRLPNRNAFEDHLKRVLAETQRSGKPAAVCYFDLDNFKVVNDTCGHTAGDELLKQISHVLRSNLQSGDHISRLGGDEFGIVFGDCDIEDARDRASRLRALIEEFRFVWRRHIFSFTASCGVAMIGRDTESFTRILADADAACFDAKDVGGNRVVVASANGEEPSRHSAAMQWAVKINDALESDRFELYCMEIAPLKTQHTDRVRFEVLIRMREEDGRILGPGTFIPAAERFKLMPKLDRWVVRSTIRRLARNADVIHRMDSCSINLSGASLGDASFLEWLRGELTASAVPPVKLCFEITETAAVGDLGHAMEFIDEVRTLGCRFALDDFGSGLSSFGYLRSLQVDYLKIDGTFVRDIVENPVDRAMVRSINEVGQVMGKQTIAEYVETPAISETLREIGVNFAQGHAVGLAMPMERFLNERVRNASGEFQIGGQETPRPA